MVSIIEDKMVTFYGKQGAATKSLNSDGFECMDVSTGKNSVFHRKLSIESQSKGRISIFSASSENNQHKTYRYMLGLVKVQ